MSYHMKTRLQRAKAPADKSFEPSVRSRPTPLTVPAPVQASTDLVALQAKLEQAAKYGHHLGGFSIFPPTPAQHTPVQRAAADEEELQTKPDTTAPMQREASEEEEMQMKAESPSLLQRAEDEEELQMKEMGVPVPAISLPPKGGGNPLPMPVLTKMESAFQTDFSDVRVHEGSAAKSIGALAYTQGTDIHFQPGQYNPASTGGQELLGHELTHVVQQRAGRVAAPPGAGVPINADPGLEAEADMTGAQAARHEAPTLAAL